MKTYFIDRNEKKEIIAVFSRPQHKNQEALKEDDQEIIEYLENMNNAEKERSDIESKIQQEIRSVAIQSLKGRGEIPEDYNE